MSNEDALAAWPAELLTAWSAARLPSLHDLVTAQERMASEIRRQNQELRRLTDAAATATATDTAASEAEEPADPVAPAIEHLANRIDALAAATADHHDRPLMELADATATHYRAMVVALTRIEALVPARRGFFGRSPAWRDPLLAMLASQVDGARLLAARSRDAARAQRLLAIDPDLGAAFDPVRHQALERTVAAGLAPGRIARVVRLGWERDEVILAPALVSVSM